MPWFPELLSRSASSARAAVPLVAVLLGVAGWLSVSLNLDPRQAAISLGGRPLSGALAAAPAASQTFEALTRGWRLAVSRESATALPATGPLLAAAWPPATALLVYLLGRGLLRRRRGERQVDNVSELPRQDDVSVLSREVDDIFDLSPDLLCVAGLDGYFKRVNPAFEQTLGYEPAELLSRPLLEFVHRDDRTRTAKMIAELPETRHVSDFENRLVRADGAVRWLQWNARAMPERGLMYAAARDVTENRMLSQEQAALRRVATLVAQGHDAFKLFDAVAGEVGRLLSADATRLLRYRQDGTTAVVGSYGAADAELGADSYNPGALWRRIAERGVGAAAAAAAPIVVSGRPWGAIVAAWKQPEMAGGDTEIRIGQFTELVATSVANAESGAALAASRRRIVTAADEARRRIERDLHDGAQQRLVHAIINLKLAQRVFREDNREAESLVGEALEHAERGINDLRELARGIHPRILSSGGLGRALETLAGQSPVPATVVAKTQARLPEPVEVAAYYVASEALTNAAKHAHASAVDIAVEADGGSLVLNIRDDGVGGADLSRGSGLVSLRDRVQALGGALEVRSETGRGTELIARIPIAVSPPS